MIWVAVTPLAVAVILARYAQALTRRVRPAIAVKLLTGLSLTVALCSGLVLSVLAVLTCAQYGPFPSLGQWSAHSLRIHMEFPVALGLVASIVVVFLLGAAMVRVGRSVQTLRRSRRSAASLEPSVGALVVIEDDAPVAYSVAGRGGRIVVSTSMLAALTPAERRVLLAHEASHLRHRHHLYLHLADLAAAANPLLRSTVTSIRLAVERWADEDAAACVGDRVLAGQAVARAALAGAGRPRRTDAMAIADGCVVDRVRLLLGPQPSSRRWPVVVAVTAGLASWAAAASVAVWGNGVVQFAETVYSRH